MKDDGTLPRQTRTRSMKVAEDHYDAGNELYRQMLDATLTYTSGVWAKGFTLEDAQNAKYDLLARKMGLKAGDRILDIGCGFGGFARFASKNYGAKVTGITISIEQLKAARELSARDPNIEFHFSDYRDIPVRFPVNTFDHVVSIEMVEAVGPKNLVPYFKAASASLKEGGKLVIQGIANTTDVVNTNPWFSKYIFSDGVAPYANQLDRAAAKFFGAPIDRHLITADYDRTLLAWYENFAKVKNQYPERFQRMWTFYLLSVAGAFRSGELQLAQTVYVKGARNLVETAPVRDLPSREQLDSMRLSKAENERTKSIIGVLEKQKTKLAGLVKLRDRGSFSPLPKSEQIAIIGAGPSGLSTARELKALGYENVVIFEKAAEAGGKSHTVEFAGRKHDLGATMGVKKKYDNVIALGDEQGQKTVPFPKETDYDLGAGSAFEPKFAQVFKKKIQGLLYLLKYKDIVRSVSAGLEIPAVELADPWQVVLNRNGLGFFGEELKTYLTGYGYGGPDTPAVFGLRMFDPDAILGAAMSDPVMWENGTQAIWKGVAKDLDVRLSSEIENITRSERGVHLKIRGESDAQEFDRIVVATDPKIAIQILDTTAEERDVFSKVKHMPYSTFAVRVEGLSEGKQEVGYLRENMRPGREGHPMAWIKRYTDDNIFIFHLFAPENLTDAQIHANITEDLQRLGAKKFTFLESHRWPFFPHVDGTAIREEHFYERAANLQGLNRTVFVNEALGMSTMADAAALGKRVAQRLASGEYGK